MMLQILVICNYLIIFDNIKLFIIFDFGCWVWSVDILSYMLTHIFRYGNLSKSLTDVVADSSPRAFVPKRHFLVRIFLKIIVQQDSVWLLREKTDEDDTGLGKPCVLGGLRASVTVKSNSETWTYER